MNGKWEEELHGGRMIGESVWGVERENTGGGKQGEGEGRVIQRSVGGSECSQR